MIQNYLEQITREHRKIYNPMLPDTALVRQRQFRAPHHPISHAGLLDGGNIPRPGEISLAHRDLFFG